MASGGPLFVTAANQEGILLETYASLVSLDICRIFTDWVANQSARKKISTVLVYTKPDYSYLQQPWGVMSWELFQQIIPNDGLVQQGSWAYREKNRFWDNELHGIEMHTREKENAMRELACFCYFIYDFIRRVVCLNHRANWMFSVMYPDKSFSIDNRLTVKCFKTLYKSPVLLNLLVLCISVKWVQDATYLLIG